MRAIFYAPIARPDADAASGVQRMGRLMQRALETTDVEVLQLSLPRTFDGSGDAAFQELQRDGGARAAEDVVDQIRRAAIAKPDFWFSYHVYYKSPDWIGPHVCRALDIPYFIAEGSHAPKRQGGPWAIGHEGATRALSVADRLFAMTAFDRECLDRLAPGRVRDLKPFIDASAFQGVQTRSGRAPRLLAVGMMRNERKRASYALLADALRQLPDVKLTLTIAGDGVFRREIEAMFQPRAPLHEVQFLSAVTPDRIPALMASADIFAWPGLGEAYGLVFLEAQAAGLPVVACRGRGVPDVTRADETALLGAAGDAAAYASNLRRLLGDAELRHQMGESGGAFVLNERSVKAAARTMRAAFSEVGLD